MPQTESQWGFVPSANTGAKFILMQGHAIFDIYPQTMSHTMDCNCNTDSFSDS